MAESEKKKARTRTTTLLQDDHTPSETSNWIMCHRRLAESTKTVEKLHTRKSHTILTSLSNTDFTLTIIIIRKSNWLQVSLHTLCRPTKHRLAGINFELEHLVRGGSHVGRVKSELRYAWDELTRNRVVKNITVKSFHKSVVGSISNNKMKTCRAISHELPHMTESGQLNNIFYKEVRKITRRLGGQTKFPLLSG